MAKKTGSKVCNFSMSSPLIEAILKPPYILFDYSTSRPASQT